MHEPFIIPVTYQGNEVKFKARFERWGYTHRIAVLVGETTYTFEPDEEGGYRALSQSELSVPAPNINVSLLEAIARKIAALNS